MTISVLHNATSKNYIFSTLPDSQIIKRSSSKNLKYYPISIPDNSENRLLSNLKRDQILGFLEILSSRFIIVNKEKVIDYLENCECDIEDIANVFVYANKLIYSELSGSCKAIVQQYHDPETKDSYIAIDLRMKEYPDDITEKIWSIRERLKDRFPNVYWILISTDFVRLKD